MVTLLSKYIVQCTRIVSAITITNVLKSRGLVYSVCVIVTWLSVLYNVVKHIGLTNRKQSESVKVRKSCCAVQRCRLLFEKEKTLLTLYFYVLCM